MLKEEEMTFQIITDSTADLSTEYLESHQVKVIGLTVTVGEKSYETIGEGALTNEVLLEAIKNGESVQTSQINSGQFLELFKTYVDKGEEILYIAFSSGLSGTYQSSVIAREMLIEENPDAKITVVDSLAAASGEGFLVEEVVKLRDSGKTLSETLEVLETLIKRMTSLFVVDDLNHLARGGRIPKAVALVGTMANIKPLLDVNSEGKLQQLTKVRGKKKALNQMINDTLDNIDKDYPRIVIGYSGSDDTAKEVKESLLEKAELKAVDIRPLSPTIVAHTGEGTIAIFSVGRKDRE